MADPSGGQSCAQSAADTAPPWPATPPPPRTVARLGLCGFLRDGVDSAGFCDLYYGLKEDYSGGDTAGERWRSEHAK